jgi:chromosome segregation ATPase
MATNVERGQIERAALEHRQERAGGGRLNARYAEQIRGVADAAAAGERLSTAALESLPDQAQLDTLVRRLLLDGGAIPPGGTPERARYDRVHDLAHAYHALLTADNISLGAIGRSAMVQPMIEQVIMGNPVLQEQYAVSPRQDEYRMSLLQSPEVRTAIANALKELLNTEALAREDIQGKEAALTAAETDVTEAEAALTRLCTRETNILVELEQFDLVGPGGAVGRYALELQDMTNEALVFGGDDGKGGESGAQQTRITELDRAIADLNKKLTELFSKENAGIDPAQVRTDLDTVNSELAEYDLKNTGANGRVRDEIQRAMGEIAAAGGKEQLARDGESVIAIDKQIADTRRQITALLAEASTDRGYGATSAKARLDAIKVELARYDVQAATPGTSRLQIEAYQTAIANNGGEQAIAQDTEDLKRMDTMIAEAQRKLSEMISLKEADPSLDLAAEQAKIDSADTELTEFGMVDKGAGPEPGKYAKDLADTENRIAELANKDLDAQDAAALKSLDAIISQYDAQIAALQKDPALLTPAERASLGAEQTTAQAELDEFSNPGSAVSQELAAASAVAARERNGTLASAKQRANAADAAVSAHETQLATYRSDPDRASTDTAVKKAAEQRVKKAEAELAQLKTDRDQAHTDLQTLQSEIVKAKDTKRILKEKKKTLEVRLAGIKGQLDGDPRAQLDQLVADRAAADLKRDALKKAPQARKLEIARLEARKKALQEKKTVLTKQRDTADTVIVRSRRTQIDEMRKRIADMQADRAAIQTRLTDRRKNVEQASAGIKQMEARRQALLDEKKSIEDAMGASNVNQLTNLEARLGTLEADRATIVGRVNANAEAIAKAQAVLDAADARRQILLQEKKRLEAMAGSNPQIQAGLVRAEIGRLEGQRTAALTAFRTAQNRYAIATARIRVLTEARQALSNERAQLPEQIRTAEQNLRDRETTRDAARTALTEAQTAAETRRNTLAATMEGALRRGVTETVNADLSIARQKVLEAERAYVDALPNNTQGEVERRISRYFREANAEGVNWQRFNEAWRAMLRPGVDVADIAESIVNPAGAGALGLDADMLNLIQNDEDARKKMTDAFKSYMVKLRTIQPGRGVLRTPLGRMGIGFGDPDRMRGFTRAETRRIVDTLGDDTLQQLLDSNTQARDQWNRVTGQHLGTGARWGHILRRLPIPIATGILTTLIAPMIPWGGLAAAVPHGLGYLAGALRPTP